uniref:C-type lectin domain-containing protein n=1 Tax=Panagrolaimus superbus TaxID=310955 RepID=A0A914YL87_9BILA
MSSLLVRVTNKDLNTKINFLELSTNNTYHGGTWEDQTWIGASTKDDEKSWQWTDGTPFDYSHWEPGEPSSPGIENCIQIWTAKESDGRASAGEFNDERCQQILPYFICKKCLCKIKIIIWIVLKNVLCQK